MFVVTILAFLSSSLWAHDLARDAAINSDLSSVTSSRAVVGCDVESSDCSDEKFSRVMSGFHGHLLFGQGPFYLSHLPLYSQPHNYQAIYEVEFSASAENLKKSLKEKLAQGGYATFEPSHNPARPSESSTSFKIPQLTCLARASGDQVFWGEIHEGHFERGGKRMGNAGLFIKRVIFFEELALDPEGDNDGDPKAANDYIVFGNQNQYFAARVLGKRPAVDHIFPIESAKAPEMLKHVGDLDHARFQTSSEQNGVREFKIKNQSMQIKTSPFYTEVQELR